MGGSLRRRSDIVFFRVLLFVVVVLFFWSVCVFCFFFRFSIVDPLRAGGGSRSVTWTLQQALKVQCGAHHMTASLVRPTAEALGVVAIWLSDRTCLGRRNATHWVLRTHVTSCSSTSRIEGKLTSYTNLVRWIAR